MQQIGSALGKLFLLALLIGVGYYVYNLYKINVVVPPKQAGGQSLATAPQAQQSAAGTSTPQAEPEPRKRSAVDLAKPLEVVVYQVAEGFVRTYFGRRANVKFSPTDYLVIGNRDYAFFTVISKVTGRDPTGVALNLPWKARVIWQDNKWRLLSLELGGRPADLSGIHPKLLVKAAVKAPWLIDTGLIDEPDSKAKGEAEPEEPSPAAAEQEAEPKPEESGPEMPPEQATPAPGKAESEPAKEPPKEAATEPAKAPESKVRTWTDRSGTHKVEAEFLGESGGKVKLRKTDGSEIELLIDKLSDADQQWIRSRAQ